MIVSHRTELKVRGIECVVRQMLQISMDYQGLPDIRSMEIYEIRFFYKPLIPGLIEHQIQEKES